MGIVNIDCLALRDIDKGVGEMSKEKRTQEGASANSFLHGRCSSSHVLESV